MIWRMALWIYYGAGMAAMLVIAFAVCHRETEGGKHGRKRKARRGS